MGMATIRLLALRSFSAASRPPRQNLKDKWDPLHSLPNAINLQDQV